MLFSPETVRFRLMGQEHRFLITEFNVTCGFFSEEKTLTDKYIYAHCDYPLDFDEFTVYKEFSCDPKGYAAQTSKANTLKDPAQCVFHHFLSFNISGRKDTLGVLNKLELFLI